MPNNMQYVNCPLPPRKTLLVSSQRVMDPLQWSLMSNLHPSCANIQVRRRQNDYLSFPLTCGEMSRLSVSLQLIHCFRAPHARSPLMRAPLARHCQHSKYALTRWHEASTETSHLLNQRLLLVNQFWEPSPIGAWNFILQTLFLRQNCLNNVPSEIKFLFVFSLPKWKVLDSFVLRKIRVHCFIPRMSQNIYISPLYRWVLHQQFQQVTRRKTRGKPSNFCCLKSLFLPKRSYCLCSFWSWEVTPVSGVIRSPEWCRYVSNVTLTSWWHDSHYTMMLKTGWQGLNRTTSRAVNIHWICKCLRPLGFFSSDFF